MNDISRLNNETNLENILKEYTEKYRKQQNKPQIKESSSVLEFMNKNNVSNANSSVADIVSNGIFISINFNN